MDFVYANVIRRLGTIKQQLNFLWCFVNHKKLPTICPFSTAQSNWTEQFYKLEIIGSW